MSGGSAGPVTLDAVTRSLASRVPLYRWHPPVYQTEMLAGLERLWSSNNRRVLDVGGGTGMMAQAIRDVLGAASVVSVDVEDRFIESLDVETRTFDGVRLPFADRSFDCAVLLNVVHHVPRPSRIALMRECRRVVGDGPVYLKDHVSAGVVDEVRLRLLDLLGNIPFAGMVRASYLRRGDWAALASAAGYAIAGTLTGSYRQGAFAALFPNRLEVVMKWVPSGADEAACGPERQDGPA